MDLFFPTRETTTTTPARSRSPKQQVKKAKDTTLRFPLWPKQQRAYNSSATELLLGGAMGGGKSYWLRVAFIMWCFQVPGLQCYLFRRLYADLWANHMEGERSFPVLLAGAVSTGLVTITSRRIAFYNGARIFLCHLQHPKDISKYHGPEMHVLGFDEWQQFLEAQYRFLRTRMRMSEQFKKQVPPHLSGRFPRVIGGATPGDVGHAFVKRMFIGERMGDLEPFTIYQQPKSEGGMMRQFIPARLEDNPSLDPDEYDEKISGIGDPVLIRAYREGDWDIVAGSMFGEVWRDEMNGAPWHVRDGFPIPHGWPLWRGADDGVAAPFAGYWLTKHPDTGTIYVIDELYRTGMMADEVAEKVMERDLLVELTDGRKQVFRNTVNLTGMLDSSAFANTGQAPVTRGDQMNKLGCRWTPVEKFPGSRVARVQNFHRLLRPNERTNHSEPGIVFFRKCTNAIRTIPMIMRDANNIEDVSDDSELHAFDGVTYGLQFKKPVASRVRLGGL